MLRRCGFLVLLALSLNAFAQSPLTNASARAITSARAILNLSREALDPLPPAHVKGVITCSDAGASLCFLQDESGGIYLYGPSPFPSLGDVVEVNGRAMPGRFSPILLADEIIVTGHTELPSPKRVGIDEIASGGLDSQWVEVEGVIVNQNVEGGALFFTIMSGSSRLQVHVLRHDTAKTPNGMDARVRVRGVVGTRYSPDDKFTGFQLFTENLSFISVVQPPPPDPFGLPLRSSRKLLTYSPQGGAEHRTRVRGVVTFYWPGRDFYIRDEAGAICVEAAKGSPLELGDVVEVVGFPAVDSPNPWLRGAIYRRAGHESDPAPKRMQSGQVPGRDLECEVVTLNATVLQASEGHSDHTAVVLEAGEKVFRACFQKNWKMNSAELLPGAQVEVTGVCEFSGDGFSIWMRSPGDLRVTKASPLRQQRLYYIAGSISIALLLAGAWVGLLRMRVRRQTAAIRLREAAIEERYRDLFENANDIIYTHDLDGRVTSMNNSGQALFGYTEAEALRMNVFELVDPKDRELAMKKLQTKIDGSQRTTYELRVRTRAGLRQHLDVTSRAVYKDGVLVGIQGIARDITARKKAEEALRVSERQLRASLEERERLGRDLHDGIIQSIYAAGLNLDDCTRLTKSEPEAVERRLRKVTGDLNRVIREVRDFIMGLERHRLKGEEFKAALKSLALTAGDNQAARVELHIDEKAAAELTPVQATQLLQIAREALSNTLKHAQAQKLMFQLRTTDIGVVFEIIDDGVGFNPAIRPERGFGLRNMSVRAGEINADFQIFSQMGEGTRIVLDIARQKSEEVPSRENPLTHRR